MNRSIAGSDWVTWGCRWPWLSGRRRPSSALTSAASGSRNCAAEERTHELSAAELAEAQVEYTTDPTALKRADFIIVTVPTPVDDAKQPDLSCLVSASEWSALTCAPVPSSFTSPPSIRA